MPGNVPLRYPFPYKTQGGVIDLGIPDPFEIDDLIVNNQAIINGNGVDDALIVNGNETVNGNLVVNGSITGTVLPPSLTAPFYIATDPDIQFRTITGNQFDLITMGGSDPIFSLKNNSNSTKNSVLVTRKIRSADDAFGLDLETQGPGKYIKLFTNNTERFTVTDIDATVTNNLIVHGSVSTVDSTTSSRFISTVPSGTPPITVSSSTVVSNLNVGFLNGATFSSPGAIGTGTPSSATFTNLVCKNFMSIGANQSTGNDGEVYFISAGDNNIDNRLSFHLYDYSEQFAIFRDRVKVYSNLLVDGNTTASRFISTVGTGTSPFSVTSSTVVTNLNSSFLGGATFASPTSIGNISPNTGSFTTLTAVDLTVSNFTSTGVITGLSFVSTVPSGTPPLVVASNTLIPNLNSSFLNGNTFANPGPIGSTTTSTGAFTSINVSGKTESRYFVAITPSTDNVFFAGTALSTGNSAVAVYNHIGNNDIGNNLSFNLYDYTTPQLSIYRDKVVVPKLYTTTLECSGLFTSTVATGPPLVVSSSTVVSNLNANLLNGFTFVSPGSIGSITPSTGSFTVLDAPIAYLSTVNVSDLIRIDNGSYYSTISLPVSNLQTYTTRWAHNFTIDDGVTDNLVLSVNTSGATVTGDLTVSGSLNTTNFTSTGTITGTRFISTVSTGLSPLVVASTTVVTNLNSNFLNGNTFAVPGPIGITTASTGNFTIVGSSTANFGTVNMSGTIMSFHATRPGLSSIMVFGDAPSTGNSATMSFVSAGDNHADNRISFYLYDYGEQFMILRDRVHVIGNLFVDGTVNTAALLSTGVVSGTILTSTVSTGTAPLAVTSTTVVPNLNVSFLNGATFASPGPIGSTTPSTSNFTTTTSSRFISTVATGTAPFTVASNTVVSNLNANLLNGASFTSPGPVGNTTPSTGNFTSLDIIGVVTSSRFISNVAVGTSPFTVTSTTVVPNLNVSFLNDHTFANPGPIGSTTTSTGAFTSINVSGKTESRYFVAITPSTDNVFFAGTALSTGNSAVAVYNHIGNNDIGNNLSFNLYDYTTPQLSIFRDHVTVNNLIVSTKLTISSTINIPFSSTTSYAFGSVHENITSVSGKSAYTNYINSADNKTAYVGIDDTGAGILATTTSAPVVFSVNNNQRAKFTTTEFEMQGKLIMNGEPFLIQTFFFTPGLSAMNYTSLSYAVRQGCAYRLGKLITVSYSLNFNITADLPISPYRLDGFPTFSITPGVYPNPQPIYINSGDDNLAGVGLPYYTKNGSFIGGVTIHTQGGGNATTNSAGTLYFNQTLRCTFSYFVDG